MPAGVLRIALAQLDFCVGDVAGNTERVLQAADAARQQHRADLVVFPEMCLSGYPLDDLVLRPDLHRQLQRAMERILAQAPGIHVLVGHPEFADGRLYNACSLLAEGACLFTYRKQHLPGSGVFDEKRHFHAGEQLCLFGLKGITLAPCICEDIWHPQPAGRLVAAGAQLLLNLNASPFHVGKQQQRLQVLRARIGETGVPMAYVNLVGSQDELVFDGASMALDAHARTVLQAPAFDQGIYLLECRRARNGTLQLDTEDHHDLPGETEAIYHALLTAIRGYLHKNGFSGALVGLSGGIDSALTLCLAVDALGAEHVEALLMPSPFTAAASTKDAAVLATRLGVRYHVLPIEGLFTACDAALHAAHPAAGLDVAAENMQARCRGMLLMACSNRSGKLVLCTGNKSEAAVGYSTLYGDTAGGFAPLKDVYKTQVYALAHWRNREQEVIPRRILQRPPTAELRPDQADTDQLPPYEVLDPILQGYLEEDRTPGDIAARHGCTPQLVRQLAARVDRNEYKRRQSPPGACVSERCFGRERRYPIGSAYRES